MKLRDLKNCSRLFRATNQFVKKSCFNKLYENYLDDAREEDDEQRYSILRQKTLMFKAFNILKDKIEVTQKANRILKSYRKAKNNELKEFCFSLLQLEVKKTEIKNRKAQKFSNCQTMQKVFDFLKQNASGNLLRTKKSEALFETFNHISKVKTLKRLQSFFDQEIRHQSLEVETHRLEQNLLKKRIRQGLVAWRKQTITSNTYKAIEVRLSRLT